MVCPIDQPERPFRGASAAAGSRPSPGGKSGRVFWDREDNLTGRFVMGSDGESGTHYEPTFLLLVFELPPPERTA